jgi:hypothetical protein
MTTTHVTLAFRENDENFMTGTYNGISIIYRETDKYINVTKLCSDAERDISTFKRGLRFPQIIEYWNNDRLSMGLQICRPLIELKKGYPIAQGQYIHPELIHFVAEWINIEYSFKFMRIMNRINELGHAENQPFDVVREQLIAEMQARIDAQRDIIDAQQVTIAAKDTTIATQETHIAATSVPIANSDKILTILTFGDGYKLSADSTHPPGHFLIRFTFPASMNFKQILKRTLGSYTFPNFEHYEDALQHIRDLSPKTEVLGDQIAPIQPPAADAE